jgi:O-antigen/teichoic acid export membrane protein
MHGRVARNIVVNIATAGAMLATSVISVPVILDDVGLAGYGIWTLALTITLYLTVADAGVGPAVQRFTAVARGADDGGAVLRVLWSTWLLYTLAGLVLVALAWVTAPWLVDLFDVPDRLDGDAEAMFRLIGPIALLGLLQSTLGSVQQGLERFVAFSIATAGGSVAFLTAIVLLLSAGEGLRGLAYAALIQQGTMLAVRAWSLRDVLLGGRPALVDRTEAGVLMRFAGQLQVSVLATVVNNQTDKVVVGLVASPSTLGQVGIAAQLAESGRLVSGAGLSPITSRLSQAFGARDEALDSLAAKLNRLWIVGVAGGTVIGAIAIYPLVKSWLGEGHGEAAKFGAFLVLAYGLNMTIGASAAYLRAVGRPGLEARYNGLVIVLNVGMTVALGLAAGAVGVVAATLVAYVLGTAWFYLRLPREVTWLGALDVAGTLRIAAVAVVAGVATLAWGMLMIELLPSGVSLVPVVAGAALAFVAYLSVATGVTPTPRNVRLLFA